MPTAYVEAVARQLPGSGCYNNQFATGGKHFTKKIATVGNFFSAASKSRLTGCLDMTWQGRLSGGSRALARAG